MAVELLEKRIAVVGLGYVGLPLAIEFAKYYPVLGFDINSKRVEELKNGEDKTKEVNKIILNDRKLNLQFSSNADDLRDYNIYIVTVPTPVDKYKVPDLKPLLSATRIVAAVIKQNDIVIYESTVYPGCTEEDCVPVLELVSGLRYNVDFFCGYSPERINPGDVVNTLTKIKKVTSGSTLEVAEIIDNLYQSIITAGTYKAPSIKVAEASKAIENAQRDINISFVNELALIFDKMNIDTTDVIEAASSKWNFLNYRPGLVGGHCIGVDPYYLAHKAESLGYFPQVILSGRRVNDFMGVFAANKVVKLMIQKGIPIKESNVLVLGITFKENCPDIRNSKVIDIISEFEQFGLNVDIYDPNANEDEVYKEYGVRLCKKLKRYQAIVLTVAHKEFLSMNINGLKDSNGCVIYDIKSVLDRHIVDARL